MQPHAHVRSDSHSFAGLALGLAATLFAAGPAHAEWLLATSMTRVVAGAPLTLSIVRDAAEADAAMPESLEALLETGDELLRVSLVAAPGGGAGLRRQYILHWPAGVDGLAVLQLAKHPSSRLLLVAEAPPLPGGAEAPVARQGMPPPQAASEGATVVRPTPALSLYEPMWFLLGVDYNVSAHIQLSFKYRLFDAEGPVVEWLPFLGGLHFGYTQTGVWDLASESKPFEDISYRPSLFYQFDAPVPPASRHRLTLRGGYEHESNGRDGAASRSMDMLFATADWRYLLGERQSYVGITPKAWVYLDKDENPDIQRYRGFGELGLRFGRDDGWLARLLLRRGTGGEGSTQLDLSYPLQRSILSDTAAYLHLQVFDGYGPTLLEYDQTRGTQFRIGFSIQR